MFRVERLKPLNDLKHLDGLPIVTHPSIGILESAASYFVESAIWSGETIGSLVDKAYVISIWCNFLAGAGAGWDQARESHVQDFIALSRSEGISERRLGRRISVLTTWYYFLARNKIGGSAVAEFCACLTGSDPTEHIRHPVPRFRSRRSGRFARGARPTPSLADLESVFGALADHEDEFIAHRDFALGKTVANTGLRAMGLHGLTVSLIDAALSEAGLMRAGSSVLWFSAVKEGRDDLRARLLADRRPIFTYVTEKRAVTRQVKLPAETVLLLLGYIWGPRHRMLSTRFKGRSPDELWLSKTTGLPISLGAIKNILKFRGFKSAGVAGSGQRLRAAFLTNTAVRLLEEARARFGNRYDGASILTQLAMIAGHASPDSLQHYLDEAAIMLGVVEAELAGSTSDRPNPMVDPLL